MSTSLNTLAATIFKDFIVPYMQQKTIEDSASMILKLIVIVTGIICTLFILVIENLGHILEVSVNYMFFSLLELSLIAKFSHKWKLL